MTEHRAVHVVIVPPTELIHEVKSSEDRLKGFLVGEFPQFTFDIRSDAPFEEDDYLAIPVVRLVADCTPVDLENLLSSHMRAKITEACRNFDFGAFH
ncbi:MAG: hypothetical protein P1V21_01350 [Rhizobiaceae bacterium]|nr:hypothetical protein [Rhizobiaceae bacterium]